MHGYACATMCSEIGLPTHYDVIASRECRTAARKHYTTAWRSREEAQMQHCCTSVHTSLISSSPPRRRDVAVRPGSCYTCSLAQASLRRQDDRQYWWSQRVVCPCRANYSATLACPLQSANAFSLWVLSRQVWMQLQLEHQFWKNVTGARFWKRVPDNRILLNNLNNITKTGTELQRLSKKYKNLRYLLFTNRQNWQNCFKMSPNKPPMITTSEAKS